MDGRQKYGGNFLIYQNFLNKNDLEKAINGNDNQE